MKNKLIALLVLVLILTGTQIAHAQTSQPNAYDQIIAAAVSSANSAYPNAAITSAEIKGIIQQESNFNPAAHNTLGEDSRGLMQLNYDYFKPNGEGYYQVVDSYNPTQNIQAGTMHYARLVSQYGGNRPKALAAYNWGEGDLNRALGRNGERWYDGIPADTRAYIQSVQNYQTSLQPQGSSIPITQLQAETWYVLGDDGQFYASENLPSGVHVYGYVSGAEALQLGTEPPAAQRLAQVMISARNSQGEEIRIFKNNIASESALPNNLFVYQDANGNPLGYGSVSYQSAQASTGAQAATTVAPQQIFWTHPQTHEVYNLGEKTKVGQLLPGTTNQYYSSQDVFSFTPIATTQIGRSFTAYDQGRRGFSYVAIGEGGRPTSRVYIMPDSNRPLQSDQNGVFTIPIPDGEGESATLLADGTFHTQDNRYVAYVTDIDDTIISTTPLTTYRNGAILGQTIVNGEDNYFIYPVNDQGAYQERQEFTGTSTPTPLGNTYFQRTDAGVTTYYRLSSNGLLTSSQTQGDEVGWWDYYSAAIGTSLDRIGYITSGYRGLNIFYTDPQPLIENELVTGILGGMDGWESLACRQKAVDSIDAGIAFSDTPTGGASAHVEATKVRVTNYSAQPPQSSYLYRASFGVIGGSEERGCTINFEIWLKGDAAIPMVTDTGNALPFMYTATRDGEINRVTDSKFFESARNYNQICIRFTRLDPQVIGPQLSPCLIGIQEGSELCSPIVDSEEVALREGNICSSLSDFLPDCMAMPEGSGGEGLGGTENPERTTPGLQASNQPGLNGDI